MAFAFRHFMERSRHPEIVKSCVLQLWRAQLSRARWPEQRTDLSKKDREVGLPCVADSRTSAASFACLEQLGVPPPPSAGWKPVKREGEDTPSSDGEQAEWLRSVLSPEWIYHTTEETYFHLPTSTLWEQREVECCDPTASPHTYFRVDAVHLQALKNFAISVDAAVLPLVFQAWVRFVRRHSKASPAAQGRPEDLDEEGDGVDLRKAAAALPQPARESPKAAATTSERPLASMRSGETAATESAEGRLSVATVTAMNPRDTRVSVDMGPPGCFFDSEQRQSEIVSQQSGGALLPTEPNDTGAASLPAGGKRRAGCFWLCGRGKTSGSRAAGPSDSSKSAAGAAAEDSASSPAKAGDAGGKTQPPAGPPSVLSQSTAPGMPPNTVRSSKTESSRTEGPRPIDNVERHLRRLDGFLQDVKRNPTRLAQHVERRRADKTLMAYVASA